jgi:TRAP-type C4-dicarboxylate transport system permease large subunit
MVRDVPMQQIFRGVFPFLGAMILLLVILMLVPETALYLPRTMK